jgi:hypothetical protein
VMMVSAPMAGSASPSSTRKLQQLRQPRKRA